MRIYFFNSFSGEFGKSCALKSGKAHPGPGDLHQLLRPTFWWSRGGIMVKNVPGDLHRILRIQSQSDVHGKLAKNELGRLAMDLNSQSNDALSSATTSGSNSDLWVTRKIIDFMFYFYYSMFSICQFTLYC